MFVQKRMMKASMNEIDDTIAECDKQNRRDAQIEISILGGIFINLSITKLEGNFGGCTESSHDN